MSRDEEQAMTATALQMQAEHSRQPSGDSDDRGPVASHTARCSKQVLMRIAALQQNVFRSDQRQTRLVTSARAPISESMTLSVQLWPG